jgi:hypothetical protein
MVELGLDSKKEPPTTVGGLAGGGKLGGGGKSSAAEYRELTEAEKRAAQLASDSQHTADLFGILFLLFEKVFNFSIWRLKLVSRTNNTIYLKNI